MPQPSRPAQAPAALLLPAGLRNGDLEVHRSWRRRAEPDQKQATADKHDVVYRWDKPTAAATANSA